MLRKSRILRFILVGVTNAAISFGLLNVCYYALGQSKITSSIISTSCALLFSFAMNRGFVFSDKSKRAHQQLIPFVLVTVSGSLLVLNLVYILFIHLLANHEHLFIIAIHKLTGLQLSKSFVDINVSTIIGAVVAMFWNYNGYRLFVFKTTPLMVSEEQAPRKKFDLSIVIPALREERRIGVTLDELAEFLMTDPTLSELKVEVLVVSADSPDKTHRIVLKKRKKFKTLKLLKPGPKLGKGRDVQYGMLRAQGDAVIFMDADLATPLRHLPRFYRAFLRGSEVIVATRNLRKHHKSGLRIILSNTGNMLFRMAAGMWIEDSQCGFKMFSHRAAQACFGKLRIMKWGFDMEVLAIAKANKYKIKTYRVNDWRSVPDGTFVEGFARNAVESLGELARILYRRITGEYSITPADRLPQEET